MKTAVISVTKQGDAIADKIKTHFAVDIFSKLKTDNFHINSISKDCMENYSEIIFIASTGIAVRSIAPFIKSKDIDPAVIVIDCTGKYVISLLSGHLGGANKLSIEIAKIIGAEPIITTASDNMGFTAPDMIAKEFQLQIEDLKKAKEIAALMVAGKKIGFIDDEKKITCPIGYETITLENINDFEGLVYVTNKKNLDFQKDYDYINAKTVVLKLIRKNIILGIGCRKNYDSEKMLKQVLEVLEQYNIDKRAVRCISTVEVKREEAAIISLVETLKCKFEIWEIDEIREVQHKYMGSDFVEKTIGVRAVSQPCVELSGGIFLLQKFCYEGMTLSIGEYKEGEL